MLKVLLLLNTNESYYASYFKYFKFAIADLTDAKIYGPDYPGFSKHGFNVDKAVEIFFEGWAPDVIILWDPRLDWEGLDKVNCFKILFWRDPHKTTKSDHRNLVEKHGMHAFFIPDRNLSLSDAHERMPDAAVKWLPLSVETSIFKDYKLEKVYDVSLIGARSLSYPLRMHMEEVLKNEPISFFNYSGPGQSHFLDTSEELVHENYARVINQSKLFASCSGKFKGMIAKYVEVTACKVALMADLPCDAKECHLEPDINFINVNGENFTKKMRYYLEHEDERNVIAQRGYEMVREFHSNEVRAKQLVDWLEKGDLREEIYKW